MMNSQIFDGRFCKRSVRFQQMILMFTFVPMGVLFALSVAALAQDKGEAGSVNLEIKVQGKIVDDETGEPITQMMIQAGRIDAEDPSKITWGYSETRTSSKTGQFSTTIKWSKGWTARVVVDGYLPQPIISAAPQAGTTELELVLRLKRGKPIRGRIIDQAGNPVAGANVFAISPRGLNLYQGQAHDRYENSVDSRAKSVTTDEQGRFELLSGGSESLAISSESLDAWTAKITPESDDELEIKLPVAAKLTISVDIQGADEETEVFYQLLTHLMDGFDKVESTRTIKIKNGQSLEMTSLPPGKYQFCRSRMHRFEGIGIGTMIDRTFIELKAGEADELKFVRKTGKRVSGVVEWPQKAELAGIILNVQSIEPLEDPWGKHAFATTYDSQLIAGKPQVIVIEGNSAEFKTEALAPGEYRIEAIAYSPMKREDFALSGIRSPDFTAAKTIKVTEMSGPNMLVIELKPREQ